MVFFTNKGAHVKTYERHRLKLLIQLVASSWFNHVLVLTKVAMPISKCVGLLVKNTNKGEGDRLLPGLAIDVTRQVSNNAIVVKKKESHF